MNKVFISVGMNGRTHEDIVADLTRAREWVDKNIREKYGDHIEVVDNLDCTGPADAGCLWYLGEAIKKLDGCDMCYFVKGWQEYRGCRAEMKICCLYSIPTIEEK